MKSGLPNQLKNKIEMVSITQSISVKIFMQVQAKK